MLITDIDKAYAAGYFEGRGYFRITMGGGRSNGPRIRVLANVHYRQAEWFVERWGGTLQRYTAGKHSTTASTLSKYGHLWCAWCLSLDQAKAFLMDIHPYLKRKDKVAKYAAAYLNVLGKLPVKMSEFQVDRLRRLAVLVDQLRENAIN